MEHVNSFKPERVNPGHADYKTLYEKWYTGGKGRHFEALGVIWMQITDNEGVCFVPERPAGGGLDGYGESSFKGILR